MTDEHPGHSDRPDQPGDPEDGALRDALARLDPAAALTPADPARTARLVEDTMAAPETDPTHTRTPLLAAIVAVVVLLAAVAGFSALRDDTPEEPASATGTATASASTSASTSPSASPSPEAATVLTLPEAAAARCPAPTAEVLGNAAVAVAGTVESITDGVATVAVDEVFTGDPGTTLEIQAPSAEFRARLAAVDLREGGRYLLAGTDDGRLLVCGFSGAYDADLLALYQQAFPQ